MTAKNFSIILILFFAGLQATFSLYAQEFVNGLSVHPAYQNQEEQSST